MTLAELYNAFVRRLVLITDSWSKQPNIAAMAPAKLDDIVPPSPIKFAALELTKERDKELKVLKGLSIHGHGWEVMTHGGHVMNRTLVRWTHDLWRWTVGVKLQGVDGEVSSESPGLQGAPP